jgi:hypothetical protein
MRNSTISSSIASVVSRVIASVVAAGAVRNLLHLLRLREKGGCWLELCQSEYAMAGAFMHQQPADSMPGSPGFKRPVRRSDIAQAVYTAPRRLTTVRATLHG